jgi:hypothetical protein
MLRPTTVAISISILVVLFLFYSIDESAKSTLPPCPIDQSEPSITCSVTYIYDDGAKYVGSFRNGQFNEQGTFTFPNGEKYVGNFKDGTFNGQGTFNFPDGKNYVGEFKDGKFNGRGTFTFADGRTYVGEFTDDKYDGTGTLYAANGSVLKSGLWSNNQLVDPVPDDQVAAVEDPVIPIADGSKLALVIGNSDYQNAPSLKNPKNDAVAMTAMLEGLGFTVISGTDLGKRELEEKVRNFVQGTKNAEIALFFYAGHGIQVAGKNYMLPIDAALRDESAVDFELVDLDIVSSYMGGVDQVGIVLLDACRDNPFTVQLATALGSGKVGRCLGRISAKKGGVLFGFATAPDTVAGDGIGQNSPFTTALLKQLPTRGLEIQQVMTRVKADVIAATNNEQRPWTESDLAHEVYLVEE